MDDRARGAGGRRRRLLNSSSKPPRATPGPLGHADEQTTEATSAPVPVPLPGDVEQSTDLTGRPGTPSVQLRRVQARHKGPRSLLGPDAYHVGDGIRPQTTDVTTLLDAADQPTDHADPEEILARLAAFKGVPVPEAVLRAARPEPVSEPDLDQPTPTAGPPPMPRIASWDEPATPMGAPSRSAKTDPFGLHLPTDEVDLLARARGTFPDAFERSFFERETMPLPRGWAPPGNFAAAVAVVAFGLVAVASLTFSAWIALSTPTPTVSAASPERTLPQVPTIPPMSPGATGAPPPPPPAREPPPDAAPPADPEIADLPT